MTVPLNPAQREAAKVLDNLVRWTDGFRWKELPCLTQEVGNYFLHCDFYVPLSDADKVKFKDILLEYEENAKQREAYEARQDAIIKANAGKIATYPTTYRDDSVGYSSSLGAQDNHDGRGQSSTGPEREDQYFYLK